MGRVHSSSWKLLLAGIALISFAWPAGVLAEPAAVPTHFAPFHPDPPYPYRDSVGVLVRFKSSPEVVRSLVPAPLVPNADGVMFFFIGRQNSTNLGRYHEAILGIPVSLNGRQGGLALVTYLDEPVPLATGRERGGWNKKDARFTFVEKEGVVTATMERAGTVLARVTMRLEKPVQQQALEKAPAALYYNLKLIPSATGRGTPDVAKITATTPANRKVKKAFVGAATIEFGAGPADPLKTFPVLTVLGAQYSVSDFDLVGAEVVHDYLKTETALR